MHGDNLYSLSPTCHEQIEAETNSVLGSYEMGRPPAAVALTADGLNGLATSYGASTVSLFDTGSNIVRNTIELPVCLEPRCSALGVAITADGRFAYVVDSSSDKVRVINLDTKTIVASVDVGEGPRGIALTPAPRTPPTGNEGGDQ